MSSPMMITSVLLGGPSTKKPGNLSRFLLDPRDKTEQQQRVARYIVGVSTKSVNPEANTGAGSLKFVLWRLRDIAGSDYNIIASSVIGAALDGRVSLDDALSDVIDLAIITPYREKLLENRRGESDISSALVGGEEVLVAINRTTENLTKDSLSVDGVMLYLVSSEKAGVLKVRIPYALEGFKLSGWTEVYPDYFICHQPHPSIPEVMTALESARIVERSQNVDRKREGKEGNVG